MVKFGIRTPSPKRSLKAATTGRAKRAVKRAVNPVYGKRSAGLADPKRAAYNAVYGRTTKSATPGYRSSRPASSSNTQGGGEQGCRETVGCLLAGLISIVLAGIAVASSCHAFLG